MEKDKPTILNRYTSLPVALDILVRRQVTLLSPETLEARNDAFYLERYREVKKLGTLVAICFTTRGETFHHWKVFSNGLSESYASSSTRPATEEHFLFREVFVVNL